MFGNNHVWCSILWYISCIFSRRCRIKINIIDIILLFWYSFDLDVLVGPHNLTLYSGTTITKSMPHWNGLDTRLFSLLHPESSSGFHPIDPQYSIHSQHHLSHVLWILIWNCYDWIYPSIPNVICCIWIHIFQDSIMDGVLSR